MTPSSSPAHSVNETLLLRIGLLCAGGWLVLAALHVGSSGLLPDHHTLVYVMIAAGGAGLALITTAGLRRPPWALRWLILAAVVAEVVMSTVVWVENSHAPAYVRIDSGLYLEMAARLVQQGRNPYQWDFSAVYDVYRTDQTSLTPLLDGSTAGHYSYPALGFLLAIPLQAAGLPGAFTLTVTAEIAALVVLFLGAPRPLQPLILFPLTIGLSFTTMALLGSIDIVWALLMLGMILTWRRPYTRAVLYGLAAAYKQNVWLLAPFLLVRLWKEAEQVECEASIRDTLHSPAVREIARFVAVSAGVFLVINLPFMVSGPRAWYQGMINPFQSNLVWLSQGSPSGLVQFGYLSLPRSYFTLATFAVLSLLLLIYWRHYAELHDAGLLAPALVMWFSPRTLVAYWVYWVIPALGLLVTRSYGTPPPSERVSWKPTAQWAGLVGGILIAAGSLLARSSPMSAEVIPPYMTINGAVMRLTVQVTNHSDHPLAPRFMVQHRDTTNNPLPWLIESGPAALKPGESGIYQITSNGLPTFPAHDPGQIVVTDANGDPALRAVATVGPDKSFLWPDAIPNPNFLYWDAANIMPIFWTTTVNPFGAGSITLTQQQGRTALTLALDSPYGAGNRVDLSTSILFPEKPFRLWVYLDGESKTQRGVEIVEKDRRITFVFGTEDRIVTNSLTQAVIERAAPVGSWSQQIFDLPAVYAQLGWKLPLLEYSTYRNVSADFRIVTLSLFVTSAKNPEPGRVLFSAIEQDNYRVNPVALMDETLSDPAGYYVRLGKLYEQQRNYDLAVDAYQQAQTYAPADSSIQDLIVAAKKRLEEAHSNE